MTESIDKLNNYILGNPGEGYSAVYKDHVIRPRNAGSCDSANAYGTQVAHDGSATEIWLKVDDDLITDAYFWTEGCGTTIACGSMLTEMVKNKSISQAFEIVSEDVEAALGGLPGEGCDCARLTVDTLKDALRDYLKYKNEPWRRKYLRR
jgi:nitrogen fixation NifU-like protein